MIGLNKQNHRWTWKCQFVKDIQSLHLNALNLEKRFLADASEEATDKNMIYANTCHQCAKILEECADFASQMLFPRNINKFKLFEVQAQKAYTDVHESLYMMSSYANPITKRILITRADYLKSLIWDFISV